jgi:hypothetical protein
MATKKELSLLPDAENPNSFSAKTLKWLTTVGRWVIVLTELIVIVAFISRFWLDRKNSDLSEIIRQRQAILASTQEFENEFNSFQKRLDYVRKFYENQPEYDQKIDILVKSTPIDITYKNITINQDEKNGDITINASLIAFNEKSIVDFIKNLKLNPLIDVVNITNIEKKSNENNYTISITCIFNKSKKQL